MGKFDFFLYRDASGVGTHGYFARDAEAEFPWESTSKAVWYALFTVEDGKICRYGFTSAKGQRESLRKLLRSLDGTEALLLGVWTGTYSTKLFILDAQIAIARL